MVMKLFSFALLSHRNLLMCFFGDVMVASCRASNVFLLFAFFRLTGVAAWPPMITVFLPVRGFTPTAFQVCLPVSSLVILNVAIPIYFSFPFPQLFCISLYDSFDTVDFFALLAVPFFFFALMLFTKEFFTPSLFFWVLAFLAVDFFEAVDFFVLTAFVAAFLGLAFFGAAFFEAAFFGPAFFVVDLPGAAFLVADFVLVFFAAFAIMFF